MFASFDMHPSTTNRTLLLALLGFGGAALAVLAITVVLAKVNTTENTHSPQTPNAPSKDLALPLGLADLEFSQATIEATPSSEGPGVPGFCNLSANTSGLVKWRGNRITDSDKHRRVSQIVLVFGTSFDASSYVSSIVDNTSCDTWAVDSGEDPVSFDTISHTNLAPIYDETALIDVVANTSDSILYVRTGLVRSVNWVYQISVVSIDQSDLELTDELATRGSDLLDF